MSKFTDRLSGRTLETIVRFAETAPGRRALRAVATAEYGLDRLRALDASARSTTPLHPLPTPARAPHLWEDRGFGPPATVAGRCATRDLRDRYLDDAIDTTEVLTAFLRRLDDRDFGNARFSPFTALDTERAHRDAKNSARRYADGASLGPLDGALVPVKDEHDMLGLVTRGGTSYRTAPATRDSFMVERLRAAGAIVVGKTHTTEWGMNPVGINPHFDMSRNVYDEDRAGGGSSNGAAAAVALGLCTVASGSDGGGSIRIPSALQGVFGIKPTFQRIGGTGNIFGDGSVASVGPIGQSTKDLVDFLSAFAGVADPDDFATRAEPAEPLIASWEAALGRGVRGCRIGVPRSEWEDADPDVARLCDDVLRFLAQEGAVLVDVSIPYIDMAQVCGVLSIGPETHAGLHEDRINHADAFSLELRMLLALLDTVTASEYLLAQRTRGGLRAHVREAFLDVDILALPAVPEVAPIYRLNENRLEVADSRGTRRMCRFAFLANLLGLPAGSVPVGMSGGLPVGLQFVGDAWDEASVLAVMAHCERLETARIPAPRAHRRPGEIAR